MSRFTVDPLRAEAAAWSPRFAEGALRTVLTTGLLASAVWVFSPTHQAHADSTYDGFARANGFDAIIHNQSIPTGIDIQGVGPEAEAHQTSFGTGDASSQVPYTGGTVPGLPGTAGGLFGLPVPPYPFIASSTQGGDPQTVSYPGVTLHAESTDFSTLATALAGDDASGANSTARVTELKDGSVSATATTEANALKLGNVLVLSGLRTLATVSADGFSGHITRTTTTSIGRISVPGLVLRIPAQTPGQVGVPIPIPGVPNQPPVNLPVVPIPMGGQTLKDPDIGIQDGYFTLTIPLGTGTQKVAIPAQPVLDALKSAGVTLTFQAPEKTTTGIISGTYKFEYVLPAPPQNNYYTGPTTVTQTTGLVVATVDLHPVPSSDFNAGGASGGVADGSNLTGADGSNLTGGVGVGGTPSLGGTSPTFPATNSYGIPQTVRSPLGPAVAGPSPGGSPAMSFTGFTAGVGIGNLYLALVAIALGGFTAATSLRLIGVRFLWNS